MAHVIMDHRVSWCFGTTVPPGKGHSGRLAAGCCESQGARVRHLLYSERPNVPVARQRMPTDGTQIPMDRQIVAFYSASACVVRGTEVENGLPDFES